MVFYENLEGKRVQKPFQKVTVVDLKGTYISGAKLIKDNGIFSSYDYKVKSNTNTKYFSIKIKENKKIIYNLGNRPVVSITDSKNGKKISIGKTEDKVIATIEPKDNRSYIIKFTNLYTNKPEFFIMKCDEQFRICGVYYGNKDEQVSLVCKIERNKYGLGTYGIDMAPGVDAVILISLALFFSDENEFKNYLNNTNICINNNESCLKNKEKEDNNNEFDYIYDNDERNDENNMERNHTAISNNKDNKQYK